MAKNLLFVWLAFAAIFLLPKTLWASPHILLDLPSSALKNIPRVNAKSVEHPALTKAREVGERNLVWLKQINSRRGDDEKISLWDRNNRTGIPIEKPLIFNPGRIGEDLEAHKTAMPESMREVLFNKAPLGENLPASLDDYTFWLRKIDSTYARALRWQLLEPWRDYLRGQRRRDLRGYYYLKQVQDLNAKLDDFSRLAPEEQEKLKTWLVQICFNDKTQAIDECPQILRSHVIADTLPNYFGQFWPKAERLWANHFRIVKFRHEFFWDENQLFAPFRTPLTQDIFDFLRFIERGWQRGGQKIQLQFLQEAQVFVQFIPGVTPHVNELGGNEITMDANVPLFDPLNTLILQHEFGHVLGLPDCYIEFYDDGLEAIVNYQLEVKNLMCSLSGEIEEQHFAELRRIYNSHFYSKKN